MAELTPMMKQYMQIKEANKDSILFYRLGDFYEMFFDDAKTASKELELVLTGRSCGQDERAPMCGVPYHSAESYIAKLVARGYKVAICEQVTDPKLSKGLVERDIVRVITPGTVTDSAMLDAGKNNYMMSVCLFGSEAGIAFADVSTGEFVCTVLTGDDIVSVIVNEVGRYSPKEAILNVNASLSTELVTRLRERLGVLITNVSDTMFDTQQASNVLYKRFGEENITNNALARSAGGALYSYLEMTQKCDLSCFKQIDFYLSAAFMQLDLNTRQNLELTKTFRRAEHKGSLLWVLDKTETSMGRRKLISWLEKPLCNIGQITARHSAVGELLGENARRDKICTALSSVGDIERILSRISMKTVNARELNALKDTLANIPSLRKTLEYFNSPLIKRLYGRIDPCEDIYLLLSAAIADEPPITIREGGIIKSGFDAERDELENLVNNSKGILAQIEADEKARTGIPKLRVGYSTTFGYYIEVSNSYKNMVPENYIRKQTLVNGERFITQELKELEDRILSANEKLTALEYTLFCKIRDAVDAMSDRLRETAEAVAECDVLCSYASVAKQNKYVCPEMTAGDKIEIKNGRHPVVEKMQKDTMFVPNDTVLDCGENRLAVITGPNMAGKSTYMRQIAVISIMAQAGSFVPAASASLPVVDKIFTRIGASDDLSAGQSTFMVEMSEVAYILKNATKSSLIILDEIGRGTSTYDGMSIARAVAEYAADRKKLGAKTLFATHYHELTVLEDELEGVKNYNIAAKKRGDDIIFLRRIVRGGADDSYGIEVAKLAGVPDTVTSRAKEILSNLIEEGGLPRIFKLEGKDLEDDMQISLGDGVAEELLEELKNIELDALTPIESMNVLYKLKQKALMG